MKHFFADWWRALLNLIFPTCRCLYCGQEGVLDEGGLCSSCREKLKAEEDFSLCALCPTFIPIGDKYCPNCWEGKRHWFDAGIAVFPYHGALRDMIHDFKYRGRKKWAKPLGLLMVETLQKDPRFHAIDMVVPVPLHVKRKAMRGYNQSELLAKEIGRSLGLPVAVDILCRIKDTPSQTGLRRKGRQMNLADAFQIIDSSSLRGKNILLVDDIYTTGATVETCSRILKTEGVKSVFVVTCAAGKCY
jgi:competence protein ComFC